MTERSASRRALLAKRVTPLCVAASMIGYVVRACLSITITHIAGTGPSQ